uniref:Gag-pol n=1 Tax=Castanea mollissima TaxID=60419 RepID=K0GEZ8_9ROSI|nr:gag-pol precursor [Castanea mollissima]
MTPEALSQLKKSAQEVGVDKDGGSAEELDKIFIREDKERYFSVGSQLPALEREEVVQFLQDNIDVFAWTTYDVSGIDPEFICHHLNVSHNAMPRKQPPRHASQEHAEAVKEEVNKLKQAGAIKEIFYPEWLANTVVVKKKNGKWRVCVDFTDLNKACPKDPFPIPRIDQLVDATVRHPRMSFLDAFQNYHQIPMSLNDQEKTAFRTPNGNYHYRVMPFGLKNAGSTYQRMVTRMFDSQLGRTMEAYIDDMVIKSKKVGDHLKDLHETFSVLRKHKLRLNASKCSFGVDSGKFLGYMITHRGIEFNPDQIKAILELHPPRNPKEVQKLAGMFAVLNRFISRSADRCRPFYRLLHKWKDFLWTDECNLAFEDLRQYLANPLILSRPEKKEVLYAYLAVMNYAVSLVLIRNDDGVQKPIYYISKSLQEAERRYLPLEKALLAVVHATRKLPHYFQAHTIVVLTQLPLQAIMRKLDYTGRVAKWGTKLGAYDVKYMPRTAIKGQDLVDFVAEFTESDTKQEDAMMTVMTIGLGNVPLWEVCTDGASNRKGAGIGVVLITPEKLVMEKSLRLGFIATNNEAEYEALLAGAQMVRHLGGEVVELYCDSRLVFGQINGEFEVRDERMKKYLERVKGVLRLFKSFQVRQIPRGQNAHADLLAMLATSLGSKLPQTVMVKDLLTSSLTGISVIEVHSICVGPSQMDSIVTFLQHGVLPEDKVVAEKVRRSAPRYWLSEEHKLYRRSYSRPYLLYVHPEAVEPLLEELHEGICGSHTGGRSLAHRAMTQGYWWPNIQRASQKYARKCDQCQRFAPNIHQPGGALNSLSSPWPFAKWGLNIVGPFPRAVGNKRWLFVGTDYFTKWVEAEPLANIRDTNAKKFIWKNIITRFGVLHTLISDNGLQFDSKAFRRYCADIGIRNGYSTPAYPQGNSQAEATNKVILAGLKKHLDDAKGRWVEELPHVLWAYRTTPRRSTGETPFSMTYGMEAVIPLELGFPTLKFDQYNNVTNHDMLHDSLNTIEERREVASVKMGSYQQKLKQAYDKGVKSRPLVPGDLVLRKVVGTARNPAWGKLGTNWEGPYRITSVAGIGAYRLEDLDGRVVHRPWNVNNLRRYYY